MIKFRVCLQNIPTNYSQLYVKEFYTLLDFLTWRYSCVENSSVRIKLHWIKDSDDNVHYGLIKDDDTLDSIGPTFDHYAYKSEAFKIAEIKYDNPPKAILSKKPSTSTIILYESKLVKQANELSITSFIKEKVTAVKCFKNNNKAFDICFYVNHSLQKGILIEALVVSSEKRLDSFEIHDDILTSDLIAQYENVIKNHTITNSNEVDATITL